MTREAIKLVGLGDGRSERIIRLLGLSRLRLHVVLSIAAELTVRLSGLASNGRGLLLRLLIHWRQARRLLRGRDVVLGLRLARSSRLTRGRRERGSRLLSRGVLRRLRTRFCLFPVLIDIKCSIAVQAKAAKLHSGTVHGVVSGHHNCLLLLQNLPLVAGAPALRGSSLLCHGSKSANGGASRRGTLSSSQRRCNADCTTTSHSAGSSTGRRRFCNIRQILNVFFGEFVLGRGNLCGGDFRNFGSDDWRLCSGCGRLCSGRFVGSGRNR